MIDAVEVFGNFQPRDTFLAETTSFEPACAIFHRPVRPTCVSNKPKENITNKRTLYFTHIWGITTAPNVIISRTR
jgi:hypothetical protein